MCANTMQDKQSARMSAAAVNGHGFIPCPMRREVGSNQAMTAEMAECCAHSSMRLTLEAPIAYVSWQHLQVSQQCSQPSPCGETVTLALLRNAW